MSFDMTVLRKNVNFAINGIDLLKFEGFNTIYPNIQISGIIIVLGI